MKTIKLGPECLTDDKFKMLTDEAKAQIFEINDNAEEETCIELPKGLLFLNISEDDFEERETNENVVLKIPPSILGFDGTCRDILWNLLLPSFLKETNFSYPNFEVKDYYDCKLPQRKFKITGVARHGRNIEYKMVEDEDEANEIVNNGKFFDGEHCYSAIPTMDDYDGRHCWTLEVSKLKLHLYSDDCESDILIAFDDSDNIFTLIHSSYTSFEEEVEGCAAVKVQVEGYNKREAESADNFGNYDPSKVKKLGSYEIDGGVWALRYDTQDIGWNAGGESDYNELFYFDGDEYSEMSQDVDDNWCGDDEDSEENNEDSDEEITLNLDGMVVTNENFREVIKKAVDELGDNADLNFIDVSNVTSMTNLFCFSSFSGDISKWDVSNVTDMGALFEYSDFNGDISNWDVSKVTNMERMFADSAFNNDISKWKVSKDANTKEMFSGSALENEGKLPPWYKG